MNPRRVPQIQRVLAIPQKRTDKPVVSFLTKDEIEALLGSVDRTHLGGAARTTPCWSWPRRAGCVSRS